MKNNVIVIVLALILLVLIVMLPVGPLWLTNTTVSLRMGIVNSVSGISDYWTWIGDIKRLRSERDDLAQERNQLLAKQTEYEATERENQDLRRQLGLSTNIDQKLLLAKSAGLVERGSAKYLLINKGKSHGVKQGQIVLADQVLVGRIHLADTSSSIVELPQTANTIIPAVIYEGDQVAKGLVRANFNLTARLEEVLQTDSLKVGSTIVTSGEGGTYPPNLVIGKVGRIDKSDDQVFQSSDIELPWQLSELENLFIVLAP